MAIRSATLPLLLLSALLAGCWSIDRPAIQSAPASAATGGPPANNLGGKWMLTAPGADSCMMNFGAQPDAIEGTIAPDRGCPFNFPEPEVELHGGRPYNPRPQRAASGEALAGRAGPLRRPNQRRPGSHAVPPIGSRAFHHSERAIKTFMISLVPP
jgi:hypothetical protein